MQCSGPVSCQFFSDSYQFGSQPEEGKLVFCFFLEGHGVFRLDGSVLDQENPGAFIFPSALSFGMRGRGQACLLKCSISYISSLIKGEMGSSLSRILPSASSGSLRAFSLSAHSVLRLRSILELIGEETGLRRSDYLDMVHFQLYEILILLRREGVLSPGQIQNLSSRRKVWTIEDIAEFLSANYDNAFSLDELASRCHLNASYFSRIFKEQMGLPLFEYINRLRIDRAAQLLKNSTMTVLEIAMTVGYNNVSFFNRYFRKLKGCSPGEFRRRIKK